MHAHNACSNPLVSIHKSPSPFTAYTHTPTPLPTPTTVYLPRTPSFAMEPSLGEWSTDANDALELSLVVPGSGPGAKPTDLVIFSPKFTYPVFGENETIYGYKDLQMRLRFAAHDLKPCLEIKWAKKVKDIGDVKAEDVEMLLAEHLPQG